MQGGGHSHAERVQIPGGQPGVDQKHQIQAQQGQREVDENLRGVVSTKLSKRDIDIVEKVERLGTMILLCYM